MLYYFIINGREDIRVRADELLDAQLPSLDIQYKKYYTLGIGDATRFVSMQCDLFPKEQVCFVSCGGSGLVNEISSAVVGQPGKHMAIIALGETNDMIKYWPGRDFTSVRKIIEGEEKKVDIIKVADSYCFNMINCGFDAMAGYKALRYMDHGVPAEPAYRRGIFFSMLTQRFHHIKITADGKPVNRRTMLMCTLGNACWCGGQFHSTPLAKNDDGLIDILYLRTMTLVEFLVSMLIFRADKHMQSRFFRRRSKYITARKVTLDSKDLIVLCIDGEFVALPHFDIEILPSSVKLILPVES